jgi:hypothetical protein
MLFHALIRVPLAALNVDDAMIIANELANDINVSPGSPRAEVIDVVDPTRETGALYKAMCQRIAAQDIPTDAEAVRDMARVSEELGGLTEPVITPLDQVEDLTEMLPDVTNAEYIKEMGALTGQEDLREMIDGLLEEGSIENTPIETLPCGATHNDNLGPANAQTQERWTYPADPCPCEWAGLCHSPRGTK